MESRARELSHTSPQKCSDSYKMPTSWSEYEDAWEDSLIFCASRFDSRDYLGGAPRRCSVRILLLSRVDCLSWHTRQELVSSRFQVCSFFYRNSEKIARVSFCPAFFPRQSVGLDCFSMIQRPPLGKSGRTIIAWSETGAAITPAAARQADDRSYYYPLGAKCSRIQPR